MIIPQALLSGAVEPHTKDIHPLSDCSGEVITEDGDGFHTASLWLGPALWMCFGLPDHHPLQEVVVDMHTTHSLLQCWFPWCLWPVSWKKVCYPFWVTQLLHKCSCPWFAQFVSCPSPTASPWLCSKLLGSNFQNPGMQKIVQDPKCTSGIETSAKNVLVYAGFHCTHFSG